LHDIWYKLEQKAAGTSSEDTEEKIRELKDIIKLMEENGGMVRMLAKHREELAKLEGPGTDHALALHLKDTKRRIEILKGLEATPQRLEDIRTFENLLEDKRKEGKQPSNELKAAEQRRQGLSKKMAKLEAEALEITEAEDELGRRKDKLNMAERELQRQIHQADEEVEEYRLAVLSQSTSACMVTPAQVVAFKSQMEANTTVVEAARTAFAAAGYGNNPALTAILESLMGMVTTSSGLLGAAATPPPPATAPSEGRRTGWHTVLPNRKSKPETVAVPSCYDMDAEGDINLEILMRQ
jgi:myosin heavy subunit